jgi:hypothetical protein
MNGAAMTIWTVIGVISAVIVMAWCGWRINAAPGWGEWGLKAILMALFFGAASSAAEMLMQGNWDWAQALLLSSMAAYCVWGYLRDRRCRCSPAAPATISHQVHP